MNVHEMTPQERLSIVFQNLPRSPEMVRVRSEIMAEQGPFTAEDLARTIVAWKREKRRRERMEFKNDALAARAKEKGMDEYEVLERAAIYEFEAGWPKWKAEAYALKECTCEGENCVKATTEHTQNADPFERAGHGAREEPERLRDRGNRAFDPFA